MEKKVSVIMPTYNTEETYLREAVLSILNQSYRNLELIIVDDGSCAELWKKTEKLPTLDSRIILLRNPQNKGLVYTLNRALDNANGEYVFRMDADDVSRKDRIKYTVDFMEKNPQIDIAGTQYRFIKNGKRTLRRTYLPETDDAIKTRLLWSSPLCHPSVCFRKESIDKYHIRYSPLEKTEDYNLWVECAMKGCKFANLSKPLLWYRIHSKQITQTATTVLGSSSVSIRKKLFNYLKLELTEQEFAIYQKFATGCATTVSLLKDTEKIINKIIMKIPTDYADNRVAKKIMAQRYYHECLRAVLSGNKEASKLFWQTELATHIGHKFTRWIVMYMAGLIMAGKSKNH